MFHVPERYRLITGPLRSAKSYGNNGGFFIPASTNRGRKLVIIASDGMGWEHVSVHVKKGEASLTPYWEEMCFIKNLFWDDEDVVMQLHPRKSEYVNNHTNTLHLWRPTQGVIPEPPSILVGIKGAQDGKETI
jgi:hypothetical protein